MKKFNRIWMWMAIAATSFSFTSCDDDDYWHDDYYWYDDYNHGGVSVSAFIPCIIQKKAVTAD